MPTDPHNRREQDVEVALRFAHLEAMIERLTDKIDSNTKSTEDLVQMWEGSKWLVSFVKGFVLLAGGITALLVAFDKFKGH